MPFVFALFALTLLVMFDVESDSPRLATHRRALFALTIVSTLVQPATTLALVPAVPVYLILSGRITRAMVKGLAGPFIIPGTLVVLGQVWFLASEVSPWEQATWIWRPLWSWSYFGLDRPAFWTTGLFFLLCLWAGGRRFLADPAVALSMIAVVVSVLPFLFLEQTGIYVTDGDLGVPPMMAMILLFVSSLRFILIELQALWEERTSRNGVPLWSIGVGVMLTVMVCAGTFDVITAAGLVPEI